MNTLIRRSSAIVGCRFHFFHTATSTAPLINDTGLYGYHHLKTAKGFQRFADDAIERSKELLNHIASMPAASETIRTLDEISDTVCSVIDAAELCRHTHPDREFVEEASQASSRVNDFLHYLNSNHSIYKAVLKAEQEGNSLTDEGKRAARFLRMDLENGGIHLSPERLDRVNQLNMEIVQLCRQFSTNVVTDPGQVDIFPASRVSKTWRHLVKPIYRFPRGTSKGSILSRDSVKEKGFRLITSPNSLQHVLQCVSDAEVRKMAYIQGNSAPRANLEVLDKLIAARHEFAQILGYKSYSAFSLHSTMAASPEVVFSFLHEMSKLVRAKADKEFKAIEEFKRVKSCDQGGGLEPWDEGYFTWLMKSSAYNLNSLAVASYFPLARCIEGLKILVESLFGVTFRQIPLAPGESWHPDVIKILLHHPNEGELGYLYLDLKSRKGKHPICAHFAIRGGRRISETEYQLPIVALICDFSGPSSTSVMLNQLEVETLFHEFGHALHSLLSRTEYQHFSGTRAVLDFAETPSTLFEHFALDYRVLRRFAKHYSTGDVIPKELVESMLGAKNMFAATELQRQIFYALVDQTLFGEQPSSVRDSLSIVADLKRQHTSWKHVEGTHWHTRFNHLTNYGAGYYSYLYAKCFSATIWEKICQEDPLSPATGSALRMKFLQHGGAKDATNILNDLVGNGITRPAGEGVIPDVTSLCNMLELTKC
nr:probable mitochondrial intermediate peptidase, mitochondrial [Ipomoea trifida]